MKKILKYTGIVFLSILVLAFLIPILFKGKIVKMVKAEINKNLEAKVDFKDVNISLFRHFPKLSIGLEDISITGVHSFEKDTLLSASTLDVSVNLWSAVKGKEMKVYGVYLQSPRIHALINKEGKANWEITKEDSTASNKNGEGSSFKIKLEKYAIKNGYVVYKDESSDMSAELSGLDHEGSGDLTSDVFTLATQTKASSASFNYGGVPYLINAKTGIEADIIIDNNKSRYSFKNAAIDLNNLKLTTDGYVQIDNDSTYTMDLKFGALSSEFKNFLSLVPAIYRTDFDKLKTSGTASFNGYVKGSYSPTQLPAYSVDLDVKNGFFQYPDLPQPVRNINITMQVSNPDGVMDHTVTNISQGHLEMGNEPFDFRLLFKNPETIQYIDAIAKGKLNLSNVGNFVKLPSGTKLSGMVAADAFAKGSLSAIEKQTADFIAGGFFAINNLYYASKDFPQPIQNGNFKIEFENKGGVADATTINITSGHLELGNDPFDFSLKLSQPVSAMNFSGTAKGRFTLDNVNQFTQLQPGTSIKGQLDGDVSFNGSKADIDKKNYDKINTTGTVNFNNVRYVSKEYPGGVNIQTAQLKFNSQNVALNHFDGHFQNTHFTADGVLNNMIGYALHNQELKGTINVVADKIMLNEWMGTTDTTTSGNSSSGPFLVPSNMNITVNAKADAVQYDKVTYKNVNGSLIMQDETIQLKDVQTEALDGSIALNGSYSTKQNKIKPDIGLSYNVKNVDIQKAFYAYNTVQKLMPAGKFLAGKLTSQFSMTGKLNEDMFPDLTSLTGNGTLFLIEGVLSKFQPLDKLASTLDVNELKDVSLKDLKSHFEFANGKMLIKPFNLKVKDIDMQIGGMHGLDQSIDYIIGMKVPRKYLGTSGNALVDNLAAQANRKGIPVSLSDMIDLNVKMSGSITNPVIKTDLKQAAGDVTKELKQQATAFVQQKTEETKQTLKDTAAAIKNQVVSDVKTELVSQLTGIKDSSNKISLQDTKQKTVETLRSTFGGLLKKKKTADSTKRD
jgi:AsmA-like C-terminal region